MINILLMLYGIINLTIIIKLLRKNFLFSIVYILLFLYSYFPLIGYSKFPDQVMLRCGGQYYGIKYFYPFYMYMSVFMILSYTFFIVLLKVKVSLEGKAINFFFPYRKYIFYFINYFCLIYCGVKLILNFSNASYNNQIILKSDKLWFFLFEFLGIFILLLSNQLLVGISNRNISFVNTILLICNIIIFLTTSFIFGQRIEIFMLLCGLLCMLMFFYEETIMKKKYIIYKYMCVVFILALVIFQLIRGSRGDAVTSVDIIEILKNTWNSLFDLEFWVFQDWRNPALSLVTCMAHSLTDIGSVFKADFFNLFSIFTNKTYSITAEIKNTFDTTSNTGYGIYFSTEGYLILGNFGCILSAFLIALYYKVYIVLFSIKNNKQYHSFLMGILAFYAISLVRGYSLFFMKGIIYYVIPAIILYALYNGTIIKFVKKYR